PTSPLFPYTSLFRSLITPAGTAKQQPVQVQRTLDTLAVIARGVAPGDMVVTDGQSRLTADARVEVRGGPSSEADPQPASPAKQKPRALGGCSSTRPSRRRWGCWRSRCS